ncbi:hypothetical protein B0H13DRAFT_1911458 [Mycena leptocephala]|nr:hypothetical protein B0H13DRAFT_1911458 [Mycena leptocephala]
MCSGTELGVAWTVQLLLTRTDLLKLEQAVYNPAHSRLYIFVWLQDLQEGRQSKYDDSFSLLPLIKEANLHFNWVPEVLVYDSVKKIYLFMTYTVLAFSYSKGLYKLELNWEYCLVNLTVLGYHEDNALASPLKQINKRKLVVLNIDDDSNDDCRCKNRCSKPGQGSGSGGSVLPKPAVGSGGSGSGGRSKPADKPVASGSGSASATASEGD